MRRLRFTCHPPAHPTHCTHRGRNRPLACDELARPHLHPHLHLHRRLHPHVHRPTRTPITRTALPYVFAWATWVWNFGKVGVQEGCPSVLDVWGLLCCDASGRLSPWCIFFYSLAKAPTAPPPRQQRARCRNYPSLKLCFGIPGRDSRCVAIRAIQCMKAHQRR